MSEENTELNPSDSNVFQSAEQLSAVKGISKYILKLAKRQKAPGFVGTRIHWDKFQPWYESHKEELESQSEESIETYKRNLAKWQAEKARLEVAQLKGNQIDKESTRSFLRSILSAARAMLADIHTDYTPKFTGLTAEQADKQLIQLTADICARLSSDKSDEWIDKQNVK